MSAQAPGARSVSRRIHVIELLVVVVDHRLLAGIVAPRYFGQVGKSNTTAA